jgi:hypothetical protein
VHVIQNLASGACYSDANYVLYVPIFCSFNVYCGFYSRSAYHILCELGAYLVIINSIMHHKKITACNNA